jgi:hypothetical protein
MAPSLIHEPIRKLPLWQDGYAHGRDVGLAIALNTIVAAGADQEQRANRTSPPTPANAHAATMLRKVADQVAARFRQAST